MVEASMIEALGLVLLFAVLFLLIESRFSARDHLEGYDIAIDEMKESLNIVAQVLHKLPEMVPQFQINENPLTQILQFFQQRAEQQPSLGAEQLRGDNGRFTDGENDEKAEGSSSQTPE